MTSIGAYAFYAYDKLTSVTNLATTPQTITKNAFSTYGTLHVLKGCKDVYATTDVWKNFTIVCYGVISLLDGSLKQMRLFIMITMAKNRFSIMAMSD